ncbi:MFS transporter [Arthrobacter sp. ISL-48]|uniref:MFS transporter n=1 Tax=Arthrobacter sp. ISL-48 TaxID=2819110 RepID=UPI001BE5CFA4|nr:MFS transporter [Arthrobacter sp. ISL-48]MBT2533446.1 MFS transporter [Arthrobacter sp. ISL-48]
MSRRLVLVILCLVQFVDVLGVTSATTAIPAILHGLKAPDTAAAPVATVYAMFFGGLLILGSRLGDKYGHRRLLLIGILLFSLVSVVGATAASIGQLLVARALQGAAAALSVPSALRLLLHSATSERIRQVALALWSASGAAAGALGFIVGGVLAQTWGWPSVFWVNAPVGCLLIIGILTSVPALAPENHRQRLDVVGAALMIAAVTAIVAGGSLIEAAALRIVGIVLVASGGTLGAIFVIRQRLAAEPLIPVEAFVSPNLRAGTVVSFVNTATTSSTMVLATLLLQNRLDASPVQAGLSLISFSVAVIVGSYLSRPLSESIRPYRMAALGLGTIAVGSAILVITYGTWWGIVCGAAVSGAGIGISSVAGTNIGTDVPDHLAASASGVLNTGAQLGTAIGVAALVLVASTISLGPIHGTAIAWAGAGIAALGTALWINRAPAR